MDNKHFLAYKKASHFLIVLFISTGFFLTFELGINYQKNINYYDETKYFLLNNIPEDLIINVTYTTLECNNRISIDHKINYTYYTLEITINLSVLANSIEFVFLTVNTIMRVS